MYAELKTFMGYIPMAETVAVKEGNEYGLQNSTSVFVK